MANVNKLILYVELLINLMVHACRVIQGMPYKELVVLWELLQLLMSIARSSMAVFVLDVPIITISTLKEFVPKIILYAEQAVIQVLVSLAIQVM
jgi:hypothetical protein